MAWGLLAGLKPANCETHSPSPYVEMAWGLLAGLKHCTDSDAESHANGRNGLGPACWIETRLARASSPSDCSVEMAWGLLAGLKQEIRRWSTLDLQRSKWLGACLRGSELF